MSFASPTSSECMRHMAQINMVSTTAVSCDLLSEMSWMEQNTERHLLKYIFELIPFVASLEFHLQKRNKHSIVYLKYAYQIKYH